MVYLGVFPTAIAFSTYAFALSFMTAGSLSVTTYLVPPITVLLSWVLLSEAPPAMAYVGGVLALVGVALARRHGREPEVARERACLGRSSQPRKASRLRVDSPRLIRHSHSLRMEVAKPSSRMVLNDSSA